MLFLILIFITFLIIFILEAFNIYNSKEKIIINDERFISFFIRKYLFYIINLYLIIVFFIICFYFYYVIIGFEILIDVNLWLFHWKFFLNFWIIFFLFLNFLVFYYLIYFFYFQHKILDYSFVNFRILNFIFIIHIFILISLISTNLLILYISIFIVQIVFYKFIFCLRRINKTFYSFENLNNLKQWLIFFLGDILIIVSFSFLFYVYGTFDLINLKVLVFSEIYDDLIWVFTVNKDQFNEFLIFFYITSVFYFILVIGLFLKLLYIYYWKFYILEKLTFSIFIVSFLYNILIMIQGSLILFNCEKAFGSFSLSRHLVSQLAKKDMENQISIFLYYDNIFDFMVIDLLLLFWILRILSLFYFWIKK